MKFVGWEENGNFVDVNGDGDYDAGIDALDANVDVGFKAIPEFSTIAIPVLSILGLLFFFNHRKRRKEQ
ncbi:MAG: PEF-CTERM sorting domain-containing protein [Methanosarcinales archaeon]|nr:PEF-CTERM sorting domain-containing protein [Methanosarcinales archaeon]